MSEQSSNQSPSQHKSTPEKSTLSRKVNTGQQHKSQRSSNFGQPFDLGSCANVYGLPKSKSPINFSLFGPCVDQSQRWSNFLGNPSCSNLRPSSWLYKLVLLPTCELKSSSKELVLNQRREEDVCWVSEKCSPTLTVFISIIEVCDTSAGGVKP